MRKLCCVDAPPWRMWNTRVGARNGRRLPEEHPCFVRLWLHQFGSLSEGVEILQTSTEVGQGLEKSLTNPTKPTWDTRIGPEPWAVDRKGKRKKIKIITQRILERSSQADPVWLERPSTSIFRCLWPLARLNACCFCCFFFSCELPRPKYLLRSENILSPYFFLNMMLRMVVFLWNCHLRSGPSAGPAVDHCLLVTLSLCRPSETCLHEPGGRPFLQRKELRAESLTRNKAQVWEEGATQTFIQLLLIETCLSHKHRSEAVEVRCVSELSVPEFKRKYGAWTEYYVTSQGVWNNTLWFKYVNISTALYQQKIWIFTLNGINGAFYHFTSHLATKVVIKICFQSLLDLRIMDMRLWSWAMHQAVSQCWGKSTEDLRPGARWHWWVLTGPRQTQVSARGEKAGLKEKTMPRSSKALENSRG